MSTRPGRLQVRWGLTVIVSSLALAPIGDAFSQVQPLHSFDFENVGGPHGVLTEGSDGSLYGTTFAGGAFGNGTAFKMERDGSGFQVLHHFNGAVADGSDVMAGVIEGRDGFLYGTTRKGGGSDLGTVYRLSKDGSSYAVLRSFAGSPADGRFPEGELFQASNGVLYGTTQSGGSANVGTVFALHTNGTGYVILHHFTGSAGDGAGPASALLEGSDGALYGTTYLGTPDNVGTIFRIRSNEDDYVRLHSFPNSGTNGAHPAGTLVYGSDGRLYGTTAFGGTNNSGTVFTLNVDGSDHRTLYSFAGTNSGDGRSPRAVRLVEGSDGILYGTTTTGGASNKGTIFKLGEDGSNYGILHHFNGQNSDGAYPYSGLMKGSDGALYGVTQAGADSGAGNVFKLFLHPPAFSGIELVAGGLRLTCAGGAGQKVRIDATTDLANPSWSILSTNLVIGLDGTASILDGSTTNYSVRFYRCSQR